MKSLAVKYRPTTLEEVVGQDSISKILLKQIELKQFSHAYLFMGASGTGKTTSARAFAKAINNDKGSPIEIDAASNSSVDNVRAIIKQAEQRSLDSEYKVIIIDEAHAISSQGFQAFLKCIEEPPQYTIFIFCTTEKNKIPATIKNRCQIFNFNKISSAKIADRLKYICYNERIKDYAVACDYISKVCNNQMRDAISLLEKSLLYSSDNTLEVDCVYTATGSIAVDYYFDLFNATLDRNELEIQKTINNIYLSGADLKLFVNEFLAFVLDLSMYCLTKNIQCTKFSPSVENKVRYAIGFDNAPQTINKYLQMLLDLKGMIRTDEDVITTIRVYMLKISEEVCGC